MRSGEFDGVDRDYFFQGMIRQGLGAQTPGLSCFLGRGVETALPVIGLCGISQMLASGADRTRFTSGPPETATALSI